MTVKIRRQTRTSIGVALLRYALAMIVFWRSRARQRRRLGELPPHLLADVDINAEQARREADKPFWRD